MSAPRVDISTQIRSIAENVEQRFKTGRRVLSFAEYLELFATDPSRFARDASRYLRDAFDHYGTAPVEYPWGQFTRWKIFDLPWDVPQGQGDGQKEGGAKDGLPRGALIGQEQVQEEIYRALSNFVREGRPARLVLMHGPNGSAKSTIVSCLMRGLEHYSSTDEGALYRFNWVFPSTKTVRGTLGFGQEKSGAGGLTSYAHLTDDQIDAKLLVEVRDHPLFLIPVEERRALLEKSWRNNGEPPPDWIVRGQLSHKSQQVFEALLASAKGSYAEVLKHVQVERYFISQRYRVGAVTIGPQMSVDAGERQITADRSLSALPPSLQAVTLFEAKGELIEAAGGLLEFSDLLKRPLDAFKYLQVSVETGEVSLSQQNVQLNCVMMGSANELHLDAFREHPEFASFRGRIELVRTPYLRSYLQEQTIYDAHVAPQVRRHVAPHATQMAAMFAVLTRMRKPNVDRYSGTLQSVLGSLSALEKSDLYATGRVPDRLDEDSRKSLRTSVRDVFDESESYPIYEGRIGASPREMRVVILDAAQSTKYKCLSPLAVLEEIDALCQRRSEFEWLQQESLGGGYHDVKLFEEALHARLLDAWEHEFYAASGLVEEDRYTELYDRYLQHVSAWVKKERLRNRITGDYDEPDEKVMGEVERLLELQGDAQESRRQTMSAIAAWAIDHPGQKVEAVTVFPHHLKKIREAVFAERKPTVSHLARDVIAHLRDSGAGLDAARKRAAEEAVGRMISRFGYCRDCALDATSFLLFKRLDKNPS
ncbi:MAG: serine protein kinase PrkA [Myxococcales bacterium]|nr:serine protein kinase PrkA [Myxococcales bacterium]